MINKQGKIFTFKSIIFILIIVGLGYFVSKFPEQTILGLGIMLIIVIGFIIVGSEN